MEDQSTSETILLEAIEKVDEIHEQIKEYEQKALNSILLRYSLAKKVIIDPNKVMRYDDAVNNNKWEWFYNSKYFLMSRELVSWVEDGQPKFKIFINFNPELVFNNEL
jgi:hypothetical protein